MSSGVTAFSSLLTLISMSSGLIFGYSSFLTVISMSSGLMVAVGSIGFKAFFLAVFLGGRFQLFV